MRQDKEVVKVYERRTIRQTATDFHTDIKKGLTEAQARGLFAKTGPNELQGDEKLSVIAMIFEQLNDPLIYVLLVAAAASLFLKEVSDTFIILVVVAMNAVVGVIQQGKAQKAMEALKRLSSPHALVMRDGSFRRIEARQLVPGDVIKLSAGDQIPADVRLVSTGSFKVDESALTGESVPVEKDALFLSEKELPPGDCKNMAYMSTGVTAGHGIGVVIATGMDTQIGRIAGLIHHTHTEATPLQKRLGDLGRLLSILAVGLCVVLFIIAVLQKRNIPEMLMTAISLAVAAVPEGLPAIVTIVLALSVSRMVKVRTIIRRLPCVETLGAVNVVCSDKTGTLTQNQMTVVKGFVQMQIQDIGQLSPGAYPMFYRGFLLCNDAQISGTERLGDPTELALVDMAAGLGLSKAAAEESYPRIGELPFDSTRKMMTTLHPVDGKVLGFTKGSCDVLLARCRYILSRGQVRPMEGHDRQKITAAMEQMSLQALRVLALAYKEYSGGKISADNQNMNIKVGNEDENNLIFVGMVGMIDPPRPETKLAVEEFKRAGVRTVMITGDHADTALAIARPLGIAASREECMTGSQLEAMDDTALAKVIDRISVFARVSPEHKVRIVQLLKARGNIVAMTGDGVNDAPALKAADIGIAMGKNGTDTARSASDMILADDNFATIKKAIEEGRGIYGNIKKAILFLLSSNFGEIITMFTAVILGLGTPLKASHILWINLITDSLPALALGVDKNDTKALRRRPPRNASESLFAHGGMFCTLFYGCLIALISLAAFLMIPYGMLRASGTPVTVASVSSLLTDPALLGRCQTYAFTVLGMSQLFHAIGMRNVEKSFFRMNHLENRLMIGAFGLGIFLQMIVTEVPWLIKAFGTVKLELSEWGMLIFLAAMPLIAHELLLIRIPGGNRERGKAGKTRQASKT